MVGTQAQTDHQHARALNRDPITGTPGSHPVSTGIGALGGMTAGAVVGTIAGPVGSLLCGVVGAVIGGIAGKDAGESANPTAAEIHWRPTHQNEPYFDNRYDFDDYVPAYRAGYLDRLTNERGSWVDAEEVLRRRWDFDKASSRLRWEDARDAARTAWYRAGNSLMGTGPLEP